MRKKLTSRIETHRTQDDAPCDPTSCCSALPSASFAEGTWLDLPGTQHQYHDHGSLGPLVQLKPTNHEDWNDNTGTVDYRSQNFCIPIKKGRMRDWNEMIWITRWLTAQNSHQGPKIEIVEAYSRHLWIPRFPEWLTFHTKGNARRECESHQKYNHHSQNYPDFGVCSSNDATNQQTNRKFDAKNREDVEQFNQNVIHGRFYVCRLNIFRVSSEPISHPLGVKNRATNTHRLQSIQRQFAATCEPTTCGTPALTNAR